MEKRKLEFDTSTSYFKDANLQTPFFFLPLINSETSEVCLIVKVDGNIFSKHWHLAEFLCECV